MDDLDELYRIMQNWARPHSGKSKEELAKLYFNQRGQFLPNLKGPTHDELRKYHLGEYPAYERGTWDRAYDSLPQKHPAFPAEKWKTPGLSMMDLWQRLLGPMDPGTETGSYGPSRNWNPKYDM